MLEVRVPPDHSNPPPLVGPSGRQIGAERTRDAWSLSDLESRGRHAGKVRQPPGSQAMAEKTDHIAEIKDNRLDHLTSPPPAF